MSRLNEIPPLLLAPSENISPGRKNPTHMTTPQYWIIVAPQEHVKLGVAGKFVQAGHGKRSDLLGSFSHNDYWDRSKKERNEWC
jgi:hypothetical protein